MEQLQRRFFRLPCSPLLAAPSRPISPPPGSVAKLGSKLHRHADLPGSCQFLAEVAYRRCRAIAPRTFGTSVTAADSTLREFTCDWVGARIVEALAPVVA